MLTSETLKEKKGHRKFFPYERRRLLFFFSAGNSNPVTPPFLINTPLVAVTLTVAANSSLVLTRKVRLQWAASPGTITRRSNCTGFHIIFTASLRRDRPSMSLRTIKISTVNVFSGLWDLNTHIHTPEIYPAFLNFVIFLPDLVPLISPIPALFNLSIVPLDVLLVFFI